MVRLCHEHMALTQIVLPAWPLAILIDLSGLAIHGGGGVIFLPASLTCPLTVYNINNQTQGAKVTRPSMTRSHPQPHLDSLLRQTEGSIWPIFFSRDQHVTIIQNKKSRIVGGLDY